MSEHLDQAAKDCIAACNDYRQSDARRGVRVKEPRPGDRGRHLRADPAKRSATAPRGVSRAARRQGA